MGNKSETDKRSRKWDRVFRSPRCLRRGGVRLGATAAPCIWRGSAPSRVGVCSGERRRSLARCARYNASLWLALRLRAVGSLSSECKSIAVAWQAAALACLGHRPIFELRLRQCWWRWLLRKVGRAASLLHGSARLLAVAMPWGGRGASALSLLWSRSAVYGICALVLLSRRERVAAPLARNLGALWRVCAAAVATCLQLLVYQWTVVVLSPKSGPSFGTVKSGQCSCFLRSMGWISAPSG